MQENQEKLTRREHPNRTCVARQTKHQLTINALNAEHKVTYSYVLISSHKRGYEQGAANESKNKPESSLSIMTIKAIVTHLLRALMIKSNGQSNGNK